MSQRHSIDHGISAALSKGDVELSGACLEDIVDEMLGGKLQGKAPVQPREEQCWPGHCINSIPGLPGHECYGTLVVRCFNKDNLWDRLQKMVYHAGIICRDQTRQVAFFTTKWDPAAYDAHREAVERIRRDGARICFVLLTENGGSHIPI